MNTKIFATAARHTLIDMVMFDALDISDKVGVATYIEEASEEKILQLFESVLHSETEFHSKQLLESNYLESIKGNGIINEIIWNNGRNNILMEAEGETTIKIDPSVLVNVFKSGGFIAVLLYMGNVLVKHGPDEVRKQMAYLESANLAGYDRLRHALDIILKKFGTKTPTFEEYRKAVREYIGAHESIKGQKESLISAKNTLTGLIGKSNVNPQDKANLEKMVADLEQHISKSKSIISHGGKKIDAARARSLKKIITKSKEAGPAIKSVATKVGAVGASIVAMIFAGHYIWQKFLTQASRSCSKFKFGKQKDICILKFKISAADAAIKKVQSELSKCKDHSDPEKCNHALQTEIWNWNRRKHNYMNRLAKLTGSQKPSENNSNGSDIFKARTSLT